MSGMPYIVVVPYVVRILTPSQVLKFEYSLRQQINKIIINRTADVLKSMEAKIMVKPWGKATVRPGHCHQADTIN